MKQTLFKINDALTNALTRHRQCESCGNDFSCAGLLGCWCSEIKLSDETRAKLKSRFKDCLCSDCLKAFAARDESEKAAALEQGI